MTQNSSVVLSDVPVRSIDDNKLWGDKSNVIHEVDEIANVILTASGKLTFAIHGTWGSGKTSFLSLVESMVEKRKANQEITFCWYDASTYQSAGAPETTLALRLWSILGGEKPQPDRAAPHYIDRLNGYMEGVLKDEFISERQGKVMPYELLQVLARKTGQLADFPRLLQEMLKAGSPLDGLPRKLVLVVDDLDRCRIDFIAQVLDALQRFNSVENLFILIGVDREVLLKAINERYHEIMSVKDEHMALEKYIQYTFDLPELTPDELTNYAQRCLEYKDGDDAAEEQVLEIIRKNAEYFVVGVRTRTPRAIKRSINAIRPTLKMRFSEQIPVAEKDQQLIIKEQLLAYNWRDFYQKHFINAWRGDVNAQIFFRQLEKLCATTYKKSEVTPEEQRDRRAIFDLLLERIKRRELSENITITIHDELAKLLALEPYFYKDTALVQDRQPDLVDRIAELSMGESNMEDELLRLYLQSEQAYAISDGKTSLQAAAKAYELVRNNRTRFGKSVVPRLGDLGVNAEKFKANELAEALFRLALEINEHPGVLQQFSSYILDNRPELLNDAEEKLGILQARHAEYKPYLTIRLIIQLRTQQGKPIGDELINQLIESLGVDADARNLGIVLDAIVKAGRIEQATAFFTSAIKRIPDPNSRYILMRMFADALAKRDEKECEYMAIDLFRRILVTPETMDKGDEPVVIHNLATLLYGNDYDDIAGEYWYQIWQQFPEARQDENIRRSYIMYLLRSNRKDIAQLVFDGQELKPEEKVLIPSQKKLPKKLSSMNLDAILGESSF